VTGDTALSDVDATTFEADRGLGASLEDSESESRVGDSSRETDNAEEPQIPNPYLEDAAEGDWDLETTVRYGQEIYIDRVYVNLRQAMMAPEVDPWAENGLLNYDVLENPKKF
jgi:hypothetical protein